MLRHCCDLAQQILDLAVIYVGSLATCSEEHAELKHRANKAGPLQNSRCLSTARLHVSSARPVKSCPAQAAADAKNMEEAEAFSTLPSL